MRIFNKLFVALFILVSLSYNKGIKNLSEYILQVYNINNLTPENHRICKNLQKKLDKYTKNFRNNLSLTVMNSRGLYIADINGDIPRIPASNQKIISSAYALEKLEPSYRLLTTLTIDKKGSYVISGNGDPDLNKEHIQKLVQSMINYHLTISNNINNSIKLELIHGEKFNWWPKGWSEYDKKQSYGAPITRLSLLSNSTKASLVDPIATIEKLIREEVKKSGLSIDIKTNYLPNYNYKNHKIIYKVSSAPAYALINLVNSESHNFTSEVLFRVAKREWSPTIPDSYYKWTHYMGLSKSHFSSDASGLSINNRITTKGITNLLRRMKLHRSSDYYFSSFSILGVRGTMSKINYPPDLYGRFIGKTGTLTNVKSISGILSRDEDNLIISLIANNLSNSLHYLINIIDIIDKQSEC